MLSVLASKENTENVKATTLKVCMEDFPKPMSKICTAKRDEYHSAASVLCSPPQRTPKTFKVAWNISESLLIHNPRSHNQCLRLAQRNVICVGIVGLSGLCVYRRREHRKQFSETIASLHGRLQKICLFTAEEANISNLRSEA